jgi:hypothetical protein
MTKRQREIELSFEKIKSLPNDRFIVKITDSMRSYTWCTDDSYIELVESTEGFIETEVFFNGILWMINIYDNRYNLLLLRQEIEVLN